MSCLITEQEQGKEGVKEMQLGRVEKEYERKILANLNGILVCG
jgi:hypothetical protein